MAKSRSWGQRHLERRQLTYSTANLRRVQLAWGSAGELVSTTYPSQRVVTYGYAEDKERPDSVTVSGFSGNIVGGVKYNPDNTVKTMDWNNNTARRHTLARDLRGRVTGIQSLLTASTKLTDVHYDYNSNGDVDDEWETGLVAASKTWLRRDGAAVADNARPYGYQTGHDRLQSWTDDTVGESVSYVAGRRSAQVSGGQTFIDSYGSSSPRVEQLTAHTATGEHTRSMTLAYDAGGRVSVINAGNDADATNDVTFGYGPLGNVVTTTVNSGTSTSRYDAQMRRTKLVLRERSATPG